MKNIVFAIKSLSQKDSQDEDSIQLLLFASAYASNFKKIQDVQITFLMAENDTSGWQELSNLFSTEVLKQINIKFLGEPKTPNLGIGNHKHAYNFFEYLKINKFDEVHTLDRLGFAYYLTMSKQLGLHFLTTNLVVHIVGSSLFRNEIEDKLIDKLTDLMDDTLELGSVEKADSLFVHDGKAWNWYQNKISRSDKDSIQNLVWGKSTQVTKTKSKTDNLKIVYLGNFSREDGLHLFCDAIEKIPLKIRKTLKIEFLGTPSHIGDKDSISYIYTRSANWGAPVTIKRNLSISEEFGHLFRETGLVVSNVTRREGLRARLLEKSGLPSVFVELPQAFQNRNSKKICANPGRVANAIESFVSKKTYTRPKSGIDLVEIWKQGRNVNFPHGKIKPMRRLTIKHNVGPKVSVCLAHFSRPEKLRLAIESLKKQRYKNFEVIIVDDGSPSPKVRTELRRIKREITLLGWKLVYQKNQYLGAARNFAASHASGDYLLFMDDDNVAKPTELSVMVAAAKRTNADVVTAFYDSFVEEKDLLKKNPEMRFTPFGGDLALAAFSPCYGDANSLFSTKLFEQIGGFSEDYGITHEDWELLIRSAISGAKFTTIPEPLFWYRVDQAGMFRNQLMQLHHHANLRRHIRPYIEKLPHYQSKLIQFSQGLFEGKSENRIGHFVENFSVPEPTSQRRENVPFGRVAIITRTKDRPLLLRRAIRGMLAQTFKDWLLVIVNDGGDPELVEHIVSEFSGELTNQLLVIHNPISVGMQTASNVGLTSSDSDFVIIHDDDDSWEPTFLERTVGHMDANGWNPKVGGVVTWSRVIVEQIHPDDQISIHDEFILNDKLYTISLSDLAVENKFPPISFVFRRESLNAIGYFQEKYGVLGDWDFHLKMLERYEIDVIPVALANYHHRTKGTEGSYHNSVHAQNDIHKSKRIELINQYTKDNLSKGGMSLANLLVMGQLQKNIVDDHDSKFQRLSNQVWEIDNRVKYIADKIFENGYAPNQNINLDSTMHVPNKNLLENGDFRIWPGQRKTQYLKHFSTIAMCPGFMLSFQGRGITHTAEQKKYDLEHSLLSSGKNILSLTNQAQQSERDKWIFIECLIPSMHQVDGKEITISFICKINGDLNWLLIGGQYDLSAKSKQVWKDQKLTASKQFQKIQATINCDKISDNQLYSSELTRIFLKFPKDREFELEITDIQVEYGREATNFEFYSPNLSEMIKPKRSIFSRFFLKK